MIPMRLRKKEIRLCGIVDENFTLRGLNTHRRSCYVGDMPDIEDLLIGEPEESNIDYKENNLNEILAKNLLKKGVQLPKCDQEWERVKGTQIAKPTTTRRNQTRQ